MSKDKVVKTIQLYGEDAVEFRNNLLHPSKKYIANQKKILDKISNEVYISEDKGHIVAVVKNLDLSFLDE